MPAADIQGFGQVMNTITRNNDFFQGIRPLNFYPVILAPNTRECRVIKDNLLLSIPVLTLGIYNYYKYINYKKYIF